MSEIVFKNVHDAQSVNYKYPVCKYTGFVMKKWHEGRGRHLLLLDEKIEINTRKSRKNNLQR